MKNKSPKNISCKIVVKQTSSKNIPKITTNLDKHLQDKLATSFGKLLAETFIGTSMP
jgi:hypothetical protein